MVKIAFWKSALCTDKSTQVIYDYAHLNQTILGNESVVLYNRRDVDNDQETIQKFRDHFPPSKIKYVNHWLEVDPFLVKHNIDILYVIKPGERDCQISSYKKTIVHCTDHIYQPHGDIYLPISDKVHGFLAHVHSNLIVPHPLWSEIAEDAMMQQFRANFLDPIIPFIPI